MAFRILHIILAFLIFVSSVGFTLNSHFCQNTLQSVAIFFVPENCHDRAASHCAMAATKSCCSKKKTSCEASEDKDCCKDTSQFAKADIDFTPFTMNDFQLNLPVFAHISPISHAIKTILTDQLIRFNSYIPPPLIRNLPLLFQSFLC